jgi:hypothetical protein
MDPQPVTPLEYATDSHDPWKGVIRVISIASLVFGIVGLLAAASSCIQLFALGLYGLSSNAYGKNYAAIICVLQILEGAASLALCAGAICYLTRRKARVLMIVASCALAVEQIANFTLQAVTNLLKTRSISELAAIEMVAYGVLLAVFPATTAYLLYRHKGLH